MIFIITIVYGFLLKCMHIKILMYLFNGHIIDEYVLFFFYLFINYNYSFFILIPNIQSI